MPYPARTSKIWDSEMIASAHLLFIHKSAGVEHLLYLFGLSIDWATVSFYAVQFMPAFNT